MVPVRNYFDLFKSRWRLLAGLVFLGFVAWVGVQGRNAWENAWRTHLQPPKQTTGFSNIDPTFAKDPAIDAAKLKVIGPLAKTMQEAGATPDSESAEAEQPSLTNQNDAARFDHVSHERYAPVNVCRGRFGISTSRSFRFQIPPHASFPKLRGHIASWSRGVPHPVEVLVMDESQYADFLRGALEEPLFQNQMSAGDLDFRLNGTHTDARTYYLVVNSPSRTSLTVQAKFAVVFDSPND